MGIGNRLTFVSIQRIHTPDDIAKAIRQVRRERHFTQLQLAQLANISRSGLQKIEEGRSRPATDTLLKLFSALSLDLGVLSRESPYAALTERPRGE